MLVELDVVLDLVLEILRGIILLMYMHELALAPHLHAVGVRSAGMFQEHILSHHVAVPVQAAAAVSVHGVAVDVVHLILQKVGISVYLRFAYMVKSKLLGRGSHFKR